MKGLGIIVFDMPLLDTTQHKDILGSLIADIVLHIFSWIAEGEHERNRRHQREGIDAAKRRESIPTDWDFEYLRWRKG